MRRMGPNILSLILAAAFVAVFYSDLKAQFGGGGSSGVQSINGCTTACTVTPGTYVGSYSVATLPACNNIATPYGSYAYVTDLGGGANTAKCVAGAWQHFNLGVPTDVSATSGTYTVTPLTTSPILVVTGNILSSLTMTISQTNLYPGYVVYVSRPGVLTGTIGINVSGVAGTLPIIGNARYGFVWDGTKLVQFQ